MASSVALSAVEGPMAGKTFTFDAPDTFLFGRATDCHARIPAENETASRHHFLLEVNPPDARLRDLGSRNGTRINGKKSGGRKRDESPEEGRKREYPEVDLRAGDRIEVGETIFVVHVDGAGGGAVACDACGKDAQGESGARAGSFLCGACREASVADPLAVLQRAIDRRAGEGPSPVGSLEGSLADPGELLASVLGGSVIESAAIDRAMSFAFDGAEAGALGKRKAKDDLLGALGRPIAGHGGGGGPAGSDAGETGPIPGYRIGRRLGRGGMGTVFEAERIADGRTVAVKVALASVGVDEDLRARFLREIDALSSLAHPRVVELLDRGCTGGGFWFAVELCPGGSLGDAIEARGKLPLEEVVRLGMDALEGLAFAHGQGVVHRDVKPHNVLLDGAGRAKLADFGLAKSWRESGLGGFTVTGHVAGTLAYMAREQVLNFRDVRAPADVYAMGATLFHALTGAVPLEAKGMDPMRALLEGSATKLREKDPSLPAALAEVVDRALSPEPERRFPDAGAMREALAKVG